MLDRGRSVEGRDITQLRPDEDLMETTEKEAVHRFYEIINAGSPERLDEICSPDLKGHAGAGADLAELQKSLVRIRDGKIVEITQYCDLFAIMSQIGALPTAAPA